MTITSTQDPEETVDAGEVAVIIVSDTTVTFVAAVILNMTTVAPVNPVPVIVTTVPPVRGPWFGDIPVTAGIIGATYVNLSAAEVADVPADEVTVISTVPAVPAGAPAWIIVALRIIALVDRVLPNITEVTPEKPVPVMNTVVPPVNGPVDGEIAVTVGAGAPYVNLSAVDVADVPPAVVTVTSTVPIVPAGEVAFIIVALTKVTFADVALPNCTRGVPVNPVPVMVTAVPPKVVPVAGVMLVTVGAAAPYVNISAAEVTDVPPGVVTVTSMDPAVPAGLVTVIELSLTTVKLRVAVVPKVTAVAAVKPDPVRDTVVPPVVGPDTGEMPVIAGTGGVAVNV